METTSQIGEEMELKFKIGFLHEGLAAPVVLAVRMEWSTAYRIPGTVLK
jgi:hypothetical protein